MSEQMTARFSGAAFLSVLLHLLVIALIFFVTYVLHDQIAQTTHVFEMVQGPGDNFSATAAPALGSPESTKLSTAETVVAPVVKFAAAPPATVTAPVAPPVPERTPLEAAPVPPAEAVSVPVPTAVPIPKVEKKAPVTTPTAKPVNLSKMIQRDVVRGDSQAKRDLAKERAAELKRITKEQFDAQNKKNAAASAATGAQKIARIDGEGIKNGVMGGSTSNKVGGGGGTALSRESGAVMEEYFSLLLQKARSAFEKPADVSDSLTAHVVVFVDANGVLSKARIDRSSGNPAFDSAVLAAVGSVHMPVRPDKKSEELSFVYTAKAVDGT